MIFDIFELSLFGSKLFKCLFFVLSHCVCHRCVTFHIKINLFVLQLVFLTFVYKDISVNALKPIMCVLRPASVCR